MGSSISSVYVSPTGRVVRDEVGAGERASVEEGAVEVVRGTECPSCRRIEVRLSHSFDRDVRESEVGAALQYFAEENARLSLTNKDLTRRLEMVAGATNDVEVYGETSEEKLARTRRTLESERREKWKAIEDGERLRVELVNCERELAERSKEVERLKKREEEEEEEVVDRRQEMETFKADLEAKREMRQRAIANVSSEMNRLRRELEEERRLRTGLRTGDEDARMKENDGLRSTVKKLEGEVQSLNLLLLEVRRELEEERRKHAATSREKKGVEEEMERKVELLREMEAERERLWADYDREKVEINRRTSALKDVIDISRQMLVIRENQVRELKSKLKGIEESVSNSKLPDQSGLKAEYEKQLQNIKTLKELYEERVRLMEMERDKLNETIAQHATTIEGQKGEIESLKERCGAASEELKKEKLHNDGLERDLRLSVAKSKDFENELSLINNLFTQMLLGPYNTGNDTDLDKLTELLQENHDLIAELTLRENSSEIASALPKLLLDLITQVDGAGAAEADKDPDTVDTVSQMSDSIAEDAVLPILSYKKAVVFEETEAAAEAEEEEPPPPPQPKAEPCRYAMSPAVQEIAANLPKVWRVLTELLSHHTVPDGPPPGDEKQCYKDVETPTGTRSVISVSNTFLRLKDLILEKKALQKELTRLKQLNSHLEIRLDDQEKRLSHVQCELHKTWGIVGRMRAQHQQLHNQEKILRYELQEKRIMLSELRQQLDHCKDKWERARQKNDESETEWQKLRREFAARKAKTYPETNLNDSGESGFSDEPNESGEEADNFDADRSNTQSPVVAASPPRDAVPGGADDGARRREERLKRLEDQTQLLVRKVDLTASKSNYLCNRLQELHEQYGSGEEETAAAGPSSRAEEPAAATAAEVEPKATRSVEEMLRARSERLKRLEEQCQSLVGRVTNTVQRGKDLSDKLQDMHDEYVNSEMERQGNAHHSTTQEEEEEEEEEGAAAEAAAAAAARDEGESNEDADKTD